MQRVLQEASFADPWFAREQSHRRLTGGRELESLLDESDFHLTTVQGRAVSPGSTSRKYVEADSAHLSAIHKHTMTLAPVCSR